MVEKILVNNITNKTVILYSFDGDDIHIPGKVKKLPIDAKFNWNLPSSITIDKEMVVSTNEPIEHKSNLEDAKKRAYARRKGINYIETEPKSVDDKLITDDTVV